MDIRQINDEYSVSGQITVDDLDEIKALGFKSIVCHRPDFEAPDQPTSTPSPRVPRNSGWRSPISRSARWA